MKKLHTEITIHAPASSVWKLLTDFEHYAQWNPFIRSIQGKVRPGSKFKVVLQPPDAKPMTFKPRCLKLEEHKEFRWLGHLFISGLFDGEHIFKLIDNGNGTTRFIQQENFKGLLVPLLWKQLNTKTRRGFEMMNEKLKELAESK